MVAQPPPPRDDVPRRRFRLLRRLVPRPLHPWARALRKLLLGRAPEDEPFRSVFTHTLVHPERQRHLHALAARVVAEGIPGSLVECGVADGGSAALIADATRGAVPARPVHLFDSWRGLPAASARDGRGAAAWSGDVVGSPARVRAVMRRLGIPRERIHLHAGWFEDTLPSARIDQVALLHLDADFHEPTRIAVEHFWPRLAPGAFVQVDDYDDLPGCRSAIDEFMARHPETRLETLSGAVNVRFFRKPASGEPRAGSRAPDADLAAVLSPTPRALTLAESLAAAEELGRRARALQPRPAAVAGIARGGLLPARVVADALGAPLEILEIRRGGTRVKERLARIPGLVGLASAWHRRPWLGAPLRSAISALNRLARDPWEKGLGEGTGGAAVTGAVLVVDDAQLTGRTLARAERELLGRGASSVARAVITWKPRPAARDNVLGEPALWLTRVLHDFPWSLDNPDRKALDAWLEGRGLAGGAPDPTRVLLVDLDGVLVAGRPRVGDPVVAAHAEAAARLLELPVSLRVLTHRSRPEARALLAAVGADTLAARAITAETLWRLVLTRRGPAFALRHGATKDVVLPWLEELGVPPSRVAVLDDRPDVVEAFARGGAGLALLAPSARVADGRLEAFDLAEALELVRAWASGAADSGGTRALASRVRGDSGAPAAILRTGGGSFGALRRAVARIRGRTRGVR